MASSAIPGLFPPIEFNKSLYADGGTLSNELIEVEHDKTYLNITRINKKTKKNEKDEITSYLENMNKGDRRIENELKKLKLGRWNLGMQSGLFQYDKNAYDRDREANMARLFDEMQNAEALDINMEMRTIADLEGENPMNQFDDEGNDIAGLDEDYTDGHYYPEDGDYEE